MSLRILIVSPHFPPINAPDHQRVRMSLPYFQDFNWKPIVLTVAPEYVQGVREPVLEQIMPAGLEVVKTKALHPRHTSILRVGDLGIRSLPYLNNAGAKLIKKHKIDLVYFSTTVFPVMSLGRRWYDRFGIPYVLDFQDPWLSDYYKRPGAPEPPGGRLKYRASQTIAGVLEPYTLRKARHIISVSPGYQKTLLQRYSWLRAEQFTVLPFGAAQDEIDLLPTLNIKQNVFDADDGKRHWVYVGRGGADMAFALRAFFQALQRAREKEPERFTDVRLHFIGTDYAPAERAKKTVEPVAAECGVADIIQEQTQRIPYLEALKCLTDAGALLVFGSNDPSYTASKIYPYILARKPLLGIFHEESSVVELLQNTKAGIIATFNDQTDLAALSQKVETLWFTQEHLKSPSTDWRAFEPFTAKEMTRKQCAIFDQCVAD